MNCQPLFCSKSRSVACFSLIELLVIIAIVFCVVFFAVPTHHEGRAKRDRIKCVGHLKNIGLAFRIFAIDHADKFPSADYRRNPAILSNLTVAAYIRRISNELATPTLLHCPADKQRFPTKSFAGLTSSNVSYFTSLSADDEAHPQSWLAGDRNLILNGRPVKPGLLTMMTNDRVTWSRELHRQRGNVAMGDGSVQQFNSARLQSSLSDWSVETNLLLVP